MISLLGRRGTTGPATGRPTVYTTQLDLKISTPQEQIGTGWGAKVRTDNNQESLDKFRVLLKLFTFEDQLFCSLSICGLPPDNGSGKIMRNRCSKFVSAFGYMKYLVERTLKALNIRH